MSATINTNLSSLTAYRSLGKSQGALATSMQRLSSGLRINSAKDDAAGLAIAERMSSQIRGMNVAARNANDGISLVQVAESVVGGITSSVQRIRELAVQSANGTYQVSDRVSMQAEVDQLVQEMYRSTDQANFNQQPLFDGTLSSNFQVGANAEETLNVSLPKLLTKSVTTTTPDTTFTLTSGMYTASTSGAIKTQLSAGDLVINGVPIATPVAGAIPGQTSNSAYAVSQAIASANIPGLQVVAYAGIVSPVSSGSSFVTVRSGVVDLLSSEVIPAGAITINGLPAGQISAAAGTPPGTILGLLKNAATVFDTITGINSSGGASPTGSTISWVQIIGASGNNVDLQEIIPGSLAKLGLTPTNAKGSIKLTYASTTGVPLVISGNNPNYIAGLNAQTITSTVYTGPTITTVTPGTTTTTLIDPSSDVLTQDNAQKMIDWADQKIESLSLTRAYVGATSNTLDSVISNLIGFQENLSSARSRIVDADYAVETSNLATNQILQQAGLAMVAQANQMPQQVLSLLKG